LKTVDFPIQVGDVAKRLEGVERITLVGSGKGGVGKSLVACGLGLTLSRKGYRTGLLDIDIHGSSVPGYLGLNPPVRSGKEGLEPKRSDGLRVMSVGFFTGTNPVPVRGRDKGELISQLFALTHWGKLDHLVVDMPPSMGDELLSAFSLFPKSFLILVTTPSPRALSVVSRLSRLAASERIPVAGVVVNMAYMRAGRHTTYPFGNIDAVSLRTRFRSAVIAKIPLDSRVSSLGLRAALGGSSEFSEAFDFLADGVANGRQWSE
jgi:ATP-binding protein involved in chromosome partitioning